VKGHVVEPGVVLSRANITLRRGKELVRGNSSMLPTVTAKDWQDIDFAIANKVRHSANCAYMCQEHIGEIRIQVLHQLTLELARAQKSVIKTS
jgi:hypothetical protein